MTMRAPTARELMTDLDITDYKVEELAARVEKVLALHVRVPQFRTNESDRTLCWGCAQNWPCPTVRILNGEEP